MKIEENSIGGKLEFTEALDKLSDNELTILKKFILDWNYNEEVPNIITTSFQDLFDKYGLTNDSFLRISEMNSSTFDKYSEGEKDFILELQKEIKLFFPTGSYSLSFINTDKHLTKITDLLNENSIDKIQLGNTPKENNGGKIFIEITLDSKEKINVILGMKNSLENVKLSLNKVIKQSNKENVGISE